MIIAELFCTAVVVPLVSERNQSETQRMTTATTGSASVVHKTEDDAAIALLAASFYNGFGFQADALRTRGNMVIAFLDKAEGSTWDIDEPEESKRAQEALHTNLVHVDSWIGRYYIEIHWSLYGRIPEIIQYFLDHGFHITLQHALHVHFRAGSTFSPLEVEHRYIAEFTKNMDVFAQSAAKTNTSPMAYAFGFCIGSKAKMLCEWNWQTGEGKEFCHRLRAASPADVDREFETECNFYQWPWAQAVAQKFRLFQYGPWWWGPPSVVPPAPLENKESPAPAADASLAPPSAALPLQCCVCEERVADTMVLPCEHVVVCRQCSAGLQNTPDRSVCIQCRQPISAVLMDE